MIKPLEDNVCNDTLYSELFRLYSEELHDFLYYKYGADNNPRDVVQEAFIKLWQNCEKVDPASARAFLYKVANNQMLNDLSRQKTRLNYHKQEQQDYTIESPEYLMHEKQFNDQFKKALEALSEDQRVTFMLNRVEGKRHNEIAEMLGISRKAVEKRIYKAVAILKKELGNIKF